MPRLQLLLAAAAAAAVSAASRGPPAPIATTIDLGGSDWTLTNGSMPSAVAAFVPGQTHTDLFAAGIIADPYNATNSDLQRWVALSNWTYERTFSVPAEFLAHRVVQLVSLGVDTVATVFLNGRRVFFTDNMFHRLRLDAKPFLAAGDNNTIRVEFTSKVAEAAARADACNVNNSIICPSPVQHGFDNQNYLRTEPCSFSWDWGPGFAPMGLWRPIYLQAYDSAVVRDVTVVTTPAAATPGTRAMRQRDSAFFEPADAFPVGDHSEAAVIARAFRRTDREIDETTWDASVTVYLDGGVDDAGPATSTATAPAVAGTVLVSIDGAAPVAAAATAQPGADTAVHVELHSLRGISPWMPNGFGGQQLYNISATFVPDAVVGGGRGSGGSTSSSKEERTSSGGAVPDGLRGGFQVPYPLHDNAIKGADGSLSVRVGFRTVELVQNPLPGGKSYFFKVTGVPIPVKGSNWIPADAFESRVSRNDAGTTRLEPIFVALRDSHQNMIRNWGGGIYQRDSFYDLADENGILIWEDLMFACAEKEIRDNVLRLQSHPSIALWAGNNEDERDMKNAPAGGTDPASIEAYSLLTFGTGLNNVSALDASRPLSGSSPSDGNETAEHPFSWDHQSEFYGDVHCYLYDVDNWDVTAYKRPRFMSEFGLQSWPSALTLSSVFPAEQWSFSSDMSTNRNHHPQGQSQMAQQVSMHFHLPDDCWPQCGTPTNKEYTDWSQMLWLSQLNQALGYKAEVEHFRRIRTDCSNTTAGCNMGRMYWQTNDIWQGASWAAVDWTGRYKMVQYFTARFYAPLLVSAWGTAVHGAFGASVINDHVDQAFQGTVDFAMHRWSGGVAGTWSVPFTAPPASATEVFNATFSAMLEKGNCPDATECVLVYRALDASGAELSRNFLLLAPFYDVTTMQQPHLAATVGEAGAAGTQGARAHEVPFNVTITTQAPDAPAAFVWAETSFAGRWSDNAVLLTEPELQLTFYSDVLVNGADVAPAAIEKSLKTAGEWGNVVVQIMGQGGVWSLADTSAEYTSNSAR